MTMVRLRRLRADYDSGGIPSFSVNAASGDLLGWRPPAGAFETTPVSGT
ncbi:MAG: hypothetical protein AAF735_03025 [Myxococcota bacterium]